MNRDEVTKETRNLMFHIMKAYMRLESEYGMELSMMSKNKELEFLKAVQDLFYEGHTSLHNIKMFCLANKKKE